MSSNHKNKIMIIAAICLMSVIAIVSFVACSRPKQITNQQGANQGVAQEDMKPTKDISKTVAVFGVDKDGYRPDVIFLVHFDSKTNRAKVVSIPRDTKVIWSDEQKDILRENGRYVVSKSKLNEMTSYGGIENIRELTVKHIEDMMDVTVDNYVVVNIDAFKQIVDAIGGVEVDVPQRMYYQDRSQGLYIDLQPGLQVLDGDKAEQLIRFRKGYVEGDMGRIKTEQLFLEAFAKKVMSPAIIKDIPKLIPILFKAVKTDVGLGELIGYYPYVKNFDINNLSFHTLPGEATYEPGAWYFIPEYVQIENFVRDVFYDLPPLPIDEEAIARQQQQEEAVKSSKTTHKPSKTHTESKPAPKPEVAPETQKPDQPEGNKPEEGDVSTPSEPAPLPESNGTTSPNEGVEVVPTPDEMVPSEPVPQPETDGEVVLPPVEVPVTPPGTPDAPAAGSTNDTTGFEAVQN
ncbi:MAG: LCP family protein [Cellulosilyticaceae bacterium]